MKKDEDEDEEGDNDNNDDEDGLPPPPQQQVIISFPHTIHAQSDIYTGTSSKHILQVGHKEYLVISPFILCSTNYTSLAGHLCTHVHHQLQVSPQPQGRGSQWHSQTSQRSQLRPQCLCHQMITQAMHILVVHQMLGHSLR